MNIALDYDLTYDRDPELWSAFIKLAEARGHKVWCVTKREPTTPVPLFMLIVYTSRRAKLEVLAERGMKADIWIDDEPQGILFDDGAKP